jgi:MFS superfamily sulfate permease-like transporter
MLTGVVMLIAGLLRLGSVLRFVSNAVMVGFINAVGVNIVLGQLANLTGYAPRGQPGGPGAQHPAEPRPAGRRHWLSVWRPSP